MKICFRCKEELPDDQFYTRKDRKGGLTKHGECIKCMNTRNIARLANLKMKAIQYLGGKCQFCGYKKNPKALDFHHKDPIQKDFGFGQKKNISFAKLKPELDKCLLLCSNCHREEHDRIWRENNTVNWELYNKMISYEEWPDLLKQTYEERFPPLPEKHCIDCNVIINHNADRCVKCNAKTQERTDWPTDEDLSKLIWEIPRSILANQFGVSDKAIAKRCERRNISQPKRGYWTRKKLGKI